MTKRANGVFESVSHKSWSSRLLLFVIAVLATCAMSQAASAQVTFMDFFKVQVHQQTVNNTPPAAPIVWAADSELETAGATDYSAATINVVNSYTQDFLHWEFFTIQPDKGSLDALFPSSSSLLVSLTGNTQPSVSQSIPIGPDNYPPSPPYLTGTSFDDLQGMDTSAAITLTFPSPATVGSAGGFFEIIQDPDGADIDVLDFQLSSGETSVFIPAGTLSEGASYRLEIGYTNGTSFPADPAGLNAPYFIAYENITLVDFTTASVCAADLNGDGVVSGTDLLMLLGSWGACN